MWGIKREIILIVIVFAEAKHVNLTGEIILCDTWTTSWGQAVSLSAVKLFKAIEGFAMREIGQFVLLEALSAMNIDISLIRLSLLTFSIFRHVLLLIKD